MSYLQNTILNPDRITRSDDTGTYLASISDYGSLDLPSIYDFIDASNDDWFSHIRVDYNDTLPRLAYSIYENSTYWDVIMLVNRKTPFDCLPYDDDTIKNMAANKVNRYSSKVYGSNFTADMYNTLYTKYLSELEAENDARYIIRVVKPSYMQEFLQSGYEAGLF